MLPCAQLGHDREEVIESVEGNTCNALHACYHLLAVRLERTGQLTTRAPSAKTSRLQRAKTELSLNTLDHSASPTNKAGGSGNTNAHTNGSTPSSRIRRGSVSNAVPRRGSLSGARPPRPRHSRTRASQHSTHRPRDSSLGLATNTTTGPEDGSAAPPQPPHPTRNGSSPAVSTSKAAPSPARAFHRSVSTNDAFMRKLPLRVLEGGDGGESVTDDTHRRYRTSSTRGSYAQAHAHGHSGDSGGDGGPPLLAEADDQLLERGRWDEQAHGSHQQQAGASNRSSRNPSAGSTRTRRTTLHGTSRAAVLKSLRSGGGGDDSMDPGYTGTPTTVTAEELCKDLNGSLVANATAAATTAAAATATGAHGRRRSSVSRRSFRSNGAATGSAQSSNAGSSTDLLPSIPKLVHPSQQRPTSTVTSGRVRTGSVRRRSGERRASTSSAGVAHEPAVQTIRYPLNRRMVSAKAPADIFEELQRALSELGMSYRRSSEAELGVVCRHNNVRLEAEVVKVAGLSMHGVHMQRQRGDLETYADLCQSILDAMDL